MASFSSKPIVCRGSGKTSLPFTILRPKGKTSLAAIKPSEVGAVSPSVFLLWSHLCLCGHTYVPVGLWQLLNLPQPWTACNVPAAQSLGRDTLEPVGEAWTGDRCPGWQEDTDWALEAPVTRLRHRRGGKGSRSQ